MSDWRARGLCVDPDAVHAGTFDAAIDFPSNADLVAAAEAICNTDPCPVRAQCDAFANKHGLRGVYGGQFRSPL